MFRAVLFDMDGLMIDSEPLAKEAWQQTLNRFGYSFTEVMFQKLFGLRPADDGLLICEWFPIPLTPDELVAQRNALFMEMLPGTIRAMPGLFELLSWLEMQQIRTALVTSGKTEYVNVVLQELSLKSAFQIVITGDDVLHGKPAPDGYRLAAEKLSLSPTECLVLEDAPNGIAAAQAAGMTCWAVPNADTAVLNLSGADRILASLHMVLQEFVHGNK